jgi:hypothetical protein
VRHGTLDYNCIYKHASNGGWKESFNVYLWKRDGDEIYLPANWQEILASHPVGPNKKALSKSEEESTTEAQKQFKDDFPYGFRLLETDGTALLCGLYVLRQSIMS